jgi:OmpA-OmpF porin, OOP family
MRALALLLLLCACRSGPEAPLSPKTYETPEQQAAAARRELTALETRIARGDLPKILFEFDSDKVELNSATTLDLIAQLLLNYPTLKILIFAHTDNIGSEEYNLDLSERRAKSVKTELVKRGIYPPSIRFRGRGFSQPIATNETDEGRAQNRRVEFRLNPREWEAVY